MATTVRTEARTIALEVEVVGDGSVALRWSAAARARCYHLLVIRSGAVRAYTALQLGSEVLRYQINGLSRHQRYLIALLASGPAGLAASEWWSVTPRAGMQPHLESEGEVARHTARVERFSVMPQSRRLTAYWSTSKGFIDQLLLEVCVRGRVLKQLTLEPEVTSVSLDGERGVKLQNGETYVLRMHTLFAGQVQHSSPEVRCVPAPQGEERQANQSLPQDGLIYPCLSLAPEVSIFDDEPAAVGAGGAHHSLVCRHCGQVVRWQEYRLLCSGCGAEFIPNGRGEYLEVGRLRFGTCRCCLPKKILVQKGELLVCAHSGKEHIRMPDADHDAFRLIEDLPFGLCQCCRPRRPLVRRGNVTVCSKSGEKHRNEDGRYVLVPSELVFDATAIDDLLDAGLAEICATGVSRAASGARAGTTTASRAR
jgi:hypothetical protein